MPVTRGLSAGKRKLLTRWCNLVASGTVPLPTIKTVTEEFDKDHKSVGHPSMEGNNSRALTNRFPENLWNVGNRGQQVYPRIIREYFHRLWISAV
jgi:hypothetical protein